MKLISWNVNGQEVAGQAEVLLSERADLIALQEVREGTGGIWRRALAEGGFDERSIRTTSHLVGERTNYVLTASRWPIAAVVRAREFEVPYGERVLSVVIDVDGRPLELVNTHVPDGSGNGWRKVEHFEGLYRYLARTWLSEGRLRILCGDSTARAESLPRESFTPGHRRRTESWLPTAVNAGTPPNGA